ncbi:MAG: hypothetical protein H7099_07850 [Gemmatimonadaceae bacterium]|nr:hypothetical protein [Gemmatimonadaceae bacterium]
MSDEFARLLAPSFELEDLEGSEAIAFGLWPDLTLAYVNPAWTRFAEGNNGEPGIQNEWGIGARYLDAIPGVLRPFYEQFLTATPEPGVSLHPPSHVYECSSPTVFRQYLMQVYPLQKRAGYIVLNALVAESAHDPLSRAPHTPDLDMYVDVNGIVTQCSHCRLIRCVGEQTRWDWVPSWVEEAPPKTSHGLCEMCFTYYYGVATT